MQEEDGDINGAIQSCERVMELLKDVGITGLSFNERIKKSATDTKEIKATVALVLIAFTKTKLSHRYRDDVKAKQFFLSM